MAKCVLWVNYDIVFNYFESSRVGSLRYVHKAQDCLWEADWMNKTAVQNLTTAKTGGLCEFIMNNENTESH